MFEYSYCSKLRRASYRLLWCAVMNGGCPKLSWGRDVDWSKADPVLLAYGKGRVRGFCGNPNGVLDIVPVDTVTNATLAAMTSLARSNQLRVFQVATSHVNPLTLNALKDVVFDYFIQEPMLDRRGDIIKVCPFPTPAQLRILYVVCC